MKKEAINTFGEGIIMDLNPLTTPNNVLTNALNATIITYNGNEFVLQNDMGNGRVETAYLPSGYVPVGIKEYGGIIYVASYNPLTNKGQIGSFPSPERNISSNEISNAAEPILEPGSFGDLTAPGSQFAVKLKLFPDDVIIRSGDKFSILLKSQSDLNTLQKFVSNCMNITNGKVTSPKNKLLTLSVAVLDSNNNFRDITDKLRRFDENNKEIEFTITELPIIRLNSGFFTQTFDGTPSDVDTYRQQRATNTYNNKVFGELFLIATLNTITSVDVSVEGYINKDDSDVIIDGLPPIETGTTLIFTLNYKYNCPDGVYDSQYPERYLSASDDFKNTYHCYHGIESEFVPSQVINGTLLKTTGVDNSSYKIPFMVDKGDLNTYPLFDFDNGYYSKNQSAYLRLDAFEGLLNYSITPCMTYAPLTGLTTNGTINVAKLGTGSIEINNWRYYCNPASMTLTWGLESYPLTGTWIDNVTIEFYDILNNISAPVKTLIPSRKRSYNGVFTETIQFDSSIVRGNLYLARIICTIGKSSSSELETRVLGYRWMLTTNLYNSMYFNSIGGNFVDDYYKFSDDYIKSINTISLEIITNHKETTTTSAPIYNGGLTAPAISDVTVINRIKAAKSSISSKLGSTSFIANADNYPFTLDESGIVTTYALENDSSLQIGNIPFQGYRSNFDMIIDKETSISPVEHLSDEFDKHEYTIALNTDTVTIETKMLSQIVGNALIKNISISNQFVPFVTTDNFSNVFGYEYLDADNKDLGAYAKTSFVVAVDYNKRSGHRDDHWIRFSCANRTGHRDAESGWEIRNEWDNRDGLIEFLLSNYWDAYSQAIRDTIGNIPCVVLQGPTMYSGEGWWRGTGNDCWTALENTGSARYQFLLWYTGSRYVVVREFFTFGDSNCVEMPQVVYDTFAGVYIISDNPGSTILKTLDANNYAYNDDYKSSVLYSIKTTKRGTDSMLSYKGVSYNSLMANNVSTLVASDVLLTPETKTDIINKLTKSATFHVEDSYSKTDILTITITTVGMQESYVESNNFIANGIDTALVVDDNVFTSDSSGQPLLQSTIYYTDGKTVTKAEDVPSLAGTVANLKVGKLGGRTTLLAKGTTGQIGGWSMYKGGSGDSNTRIYFNGIPSVDISLKSPRYGQAQYLY